MCLANVEEVDADPFRPALVDIQILLLLDGRLQTVLHQGEEPLGLFSGPVIGGKADGVGVVLLAVVQQAAGADLLPVDHENGKGPRGQGRKR